jgi:hypothetical protein
MDTVKAASALAYVVLGLQIACSASPQSGPHSPRAVVQRTDMEFGMTSEQAVADADVVERISTARCDGSLSCERTGLGSHYRDRNDCLSHMRTLVSTS